MTRERALELASGLDASFGGEWTRQEVAEVADAILIAMAETYEACAKIALRHGDCGNSHCEVCLREEVIAAEIRACAPKPRSL